MVTTGSGQAIESGASPGAWSRSLQWVRDYPGGAALSDRFKSAFRVALAMVITYGISLAMDWDKAFWAAISVIFCSMATSGESVNTSIDRVKGTVVASVLALLVVALFPQDRWLFLISLSLIIAVCSYSMTGGSRRRDIWFNAGFNLPIVALLGESGGELAPATFDLAILRAQQTALGAIVYSLVAVLVWPRRGDEDFVATVRGICRTQHQLFSDYIYLLLGKIDPNELEKPMADVAAQLPTLYGKLEGAAYDCPQIGLTAPAWESHIRNVRALHSAFDRWSSGFDDLAGLDLKCFIDGWEAYVENVEACFSGVDDMLAGQPVARRPAAQGLTLNMEAMAILSHVQRAAVVSCRDRLRVIGSLAEALFDSAWRISRQQPAETEQELQPPAAEPWTIDLDRLATTVRQTSTLWLTFLAIIYIEGIPIVVATVALGNAFAMYLGYLPHVPATVLFKPIVQGGLLGGIFYMLVMPHLSGFMEFGACLFVVIFAVAYVFYLPQQVVFKALWMTMLVLIIGADNQQTYSFVVFSSWFLVGVIFVTILAIAWRFPISFRAEDRLLAQLRRFLQSAAFILKDLSVEEGGGWFYRQRCAFHLRQLSVLPARLAIWASALSPAAIDDQHRKQLLASIRAFQLISYRIQGLRETQAEARRVQGIEPVRRQTRQLRDTMVTIMESLSLDPGQCSLTDTLDTLAQSQLHQQLQLEEQLGVAGLSHEESAGVYRAFIEWRGLCSALSRSVQGLSQVDWQHLRESRF